MSGKCDLSISVTSLYWDFWGFINTSMIHGPVIWTKIDDNLDFAQVLQRLYTFPVTVRIFLALKMKWEAYLKPVICIRVLSRSRILQSSSYFEEKKEAGTSARVFTRLRFLTQQVLSDFSRSLLEISFSCRIYWQQQNIHLY